MPSPSEQTPLLQTVIITPARPRYTHSAIRRFCTIALATTLIVIIVLFLIPARWLPGDQSESEWAPRHSYLPWSSPYPHKAWPLSEGLEYDELQKVLLETPREERAREWSQYYTAGPHLAGKNLSQAVWTREKWESWGVKSDIVDYDIYINYPVGHRLALLEKTGNNEEASTGNGEGRSKDSYKVTYECSMEEDVLEEDPTSGLENRVPTFHGYSATGNATAQYVYVNFGTHQDFDDLVKANVSLKGYVAIAKYGGIFRGLKVKRAQELGMVGMVTYTDPQEDGDITEENGYRPYPDGPARNPSSVQRGSVEFLSVSPGDPTTPGYPSKPGAPRQDPYHAIPAIPSVPISYRDALPILRALNGYGPKASEFNEFWQGGGLGYKGVKYNIGPSPSNRVLQLVNEQEYVTTPLWNVVGIINGTLQDEVVILGNHRDAWIAGGAGDPNSGSAAMNEVVRSFGTALEKGWKPLRTIVFASWDGEEYGLIGSTEWVEEYIPWLSKAAIAYLNVDVSTRGPRFSSAASPLLNKALYEATSLVQSPNQTIPGQTVRDVWNGHISTMGSGSDFTAFQDFAGIPSVDLGFAASRDSPVYHYHSNYDSFAWMDKFGDAGWHYHVTATRVWSLFAAAIVETPIIAFNATDYAIGLKAYLHSVKTNASTSPDPSIRSLSAFPELEDAIERLHNRSTIFDARAFDLASIVSDGVPWWKWWRRAQLYYQVRQVNDKYKYLERQFLHEDGLDGRTWFKHVVFAPGLWTGYAGATFPGLVECVDSGDREGIERWSKIIEGNINAATDLLQ
ncbi:hypothetical protein MMC28_004745 [Mycoblastus sanguinarius]|nr:hypothetical protein [Mycoblastus sanguinarius]